MSRRNVPFTFFWMVGFVFKFFGKLRSRTICRKPQKVILILDRYPIKDVKNSQKLSFFENIANCSKKWENPNPSILRIVLSYYYYPYHFLSAYWFLTLEISLSVPKISPSRCHINETSFHSFEVESRSYSTVNFKTTDHTRFCVARKVQTEFMVQFISAEAIFRHTDFLMIVSIHPNNLVQTSAIEKE